MKSIEKFFWAASPLQAAGEALGIGLLLLALLSCLVGKVDAFALGNGWLMLCGATGMWAVLRTRRYQGPWWRKLLDELLVSAQLGIVMLVGVMGVGRVPGWQAAWTQSNLGQPLVAVLLLGIGVGYFIVRGIVRLGFLWDRMRRRRMLWALTHAHLTVVVVVALIGTLLLFLSIPIASLLAGESGDDALAALMTQVTTMLFPSMMIVLVVTGMALLFVLPPSAIFSYLVARQTTRRLEHLTRAAAALRAGNYTTRVLVTGEDEVAQLQTDFNTMADNLERTLSDLEMERDRVAALLQSRRELVASVSHELRTPVATVRGYLDSIRNVTGMLPETAQRDVGVMESELLRLQRLIDDLFALSQAEAGGLALDIRPVDIGEVVRRRVAAFAPLAWQRERVDIVAEVAPELPPALADADRLDQVLVNLLRNALRHTPPGGIIAAIVTAEANAVCVEVRDTGEGIPPEDLPHIWERFYRGDNAREQDAQHEATPGAGLGLALVKELVEAMGGIVDVHSTAGEGSRFCVRLPQAASKEE